MATKYYYDDSNNLVSMTVGDKTLMFYYDQNGSVSSVLYNGVMYYYIKNLQGDIMRIVDENGNSIAIYTYDQWGKPTQMRKPTTTTVDLVNYNPFLYRGYVYDADSGLYYLQSRYYDPVTGRFLNADKYCDMGASVLGTNMFAYCENNYLNYVDNDGCGKYYYVPIPDNDTYDQSIINSNLHTKWGSIFNSKKKCQNNDPKARYTGKMIKDGYEIYTYTKMCGLRYFKQSYYYAMRKTSNEWLKYLDDNWGFIDYAWKALSTFSDMLTYCPDNRVAASATLINFVLTVFSPPSQSYFMKQMTMYGNQCDDKILIFIKVENKEYSVYYDKNSNKSMSRCVSNKTHYAYW
ncbi:MULTISPECIES: RHS repeat domain-containing protein [unclassified Ruminococcus]|uniref:RHS repeat domain-containing protein n=1 Tax=unclassified Ruminococcus TaxID=2608920 RepID=UPI00210AFFBD|nr:MULTISPECIES: RHS repeat-associated core domain-containing protein [unclassified Ruminococcus]MCQ4023224.1 hypothetical protein [Ruminococcus sp. zg-924]MCQ4115605.1 hypothetical protein [Ruminococcus sp. zg-921]